MKDEPLDIILAKVFNSPFYAGFMWHIYKGDIGTKTVDDLLYEHLERGDKFTSLPKLLQFFCLSCIKSSNLPYTSQIPMSPDEAQQLFNETRQLMPKEFGTLEKLGFMEYAKSIESKSV